MSRFQFIASDSPLKDVKNPYIEFLSINMALARGIQLDDYILDDPDIDRDDVKRMFICDSEEHMHEIEIKQEESPSYAEKYTQKKYASELRWIYSEERALQLLDYIKEHLKDSNEVELWDTWMDDEQLATIPHCTFENLSLEDIKNIYGGNFFKPEYIVIRLGNS
ncbi:MAG: hypothetical protein CVU84_02095 [Firmicutes bacterium HGW-Firmicutes-1]|jgi:thymidylate synthase|nr:MAG: hypothetical protein CVU84_02095 [Firmicutes bacterium HGW-Firmicutes-1]